MIGTRVYPNAEGWLDPAAIDKPGAYGRATAEKARGAAGHWQATAPDGHVGRLDPSIHTVVEHEDGTITVTPSIDFSQRIPGGWHGWLTRGVWRSV